MEICSLITFLVMQSGMFKTALEGFILLHDIQLCLAVLSLINRGQIFPGGE
jgi:hypothetical protein